MQKNGSSYPSSNGGWAIAEAQATDLVSRYILYRWDNTGWEKGKVMSAHKCGRQCRSTPDDCEYTHDVQYGRQEVYPHLLSERRYGSDEQWVLLENADGKGSNGDGEWAGHGKRR